jgi:hypothetical protein
MSSWLDRKYLESLAKSAFAEAQKTLDKALDIKDEEEQPIVEPTVNSQPAKPVYDQPTKSSSGSLVKSLSNNLGVSGWGSFSGSFFEAAELGKEEKDDDTKTSRVKKSQKSTPQAGLGESPQLKLLSKLLTSITVVA